MDVFEVSFKGQPDDRERQLVPRDFILIEQPDLEAFIAGCEFAIGEFGTEHHVDLADMRNTEDAVEAQIIDRGTGLFHGLARSGLFRRFAVFHEAGRQGPQPVAWLDSAPAQQQAVIPDGYAAGDDLRVLVMNGIARIADMPLS